MRENSELFRFLNIYLHLQIPATQSTTEPTRELETQPSREQTTQPSKELETQPSPEQTTHSSTQMIPEITQAGITTISFTTIATYDASSNNSAYFSLIAVGVLLIIASVVIWYKYKRQSRKITCCRATTVKRLSIIHHPIYTSRTSTESIAMTDYLQPVQSRMYCPTTEALENPIYEDVPS